VGKRARKKEIFIKKKMEGKKGKRGGRFKGSQRFGEAGKKKNASRRARPHWQGVRPSGKKEKQKKPGGTPVSK